MLERKFSKKYSRRSFRVKKTRDFRVGGFRAKRYGGFIFFILALWVLVWNRDFGFVSDGQIDRSIEISSVGSLVDGLSNKGFPSLLESLFFMEEIEGEIESEIGGQVGWQFGGQMEGKELFFEREKEVHSLRELKWRFYKVKRGDTLISIAREYEVDMDTLKSFNSIEDSWIQAGDTLEIPNMRGILHTVRKGETLHTLLRTYQKDSRETLTEKGLRKANRMSYKDEIQQGERIFIPGGRLKPQKVSKRLKTQGKKTKKTKKEQNIEHNLGQSVFSRPVEGVLTSGVGFRIHPVKRYRHFHTGLDIRASKGTKVRATKKGKVLFRGRSSGYGNLIILGHERNWKSYYAHLSEILVRKGDSVREGEVIGKVGNTGLSTGNHLHFEIRKNGKPTRVLKMPGLKGKIGQKW